MPDAPAYTVNPQRLQAAYDVLRALVQSGELPVGLLAVADASRTIRCEGFAPGGPLPTDGIFLLASISKTLCATAVLQLVEQGRLLPADPVARYIPEFACHGKESVTVRHLLTHTSGLADDYWTQRSPEPTPAEDVRGAIQTHLRFTPGVRYEYCNPSFTIMGELIRRLSGRPYPDYLREHIYQPCGMVDTAFRPAPEQQARVLPVQDFPQGAEGYADFVSTELPTGGLFSTAADLVAFGQAFLNGGRARHGRLLGPAALRLMTSLHTADVSNFATGRPEPVFWGLGWGLHNPHDGLLLSPGGYGHGGATGTHLWVDPPTGLVLVFLTNRWGGDGRAKRLVLNAAMAAVETA